MNVILHVIIVPKLEMMMIINVQNANLIMNLKMILKMIIIVIKNVKIITTLMKIKHIIVLQIKIVQMNIIN